MQEDITGRAIALLGIDSQQGADAGREVEQRACAMLQVALTVLDRQAGRERAVGIVGEAFDVISTPDRERTVLALAATPAEQFADVLLGFLRGRDPARTGSADQDAAAMLLAGIAFLQERHGSDYMAARAGDLVRVVQEAAAAGEHPVSAPPAATSGNPFDQFDAPAPAPAPATVAPPYRAGLTVRQRIDAMAGFLRASAPTEAQPDALAALTASTMFLRERFGEGYTVGVIRQAERLVSEQAALDRWRPEAGARPN